MNFTKTKKVVAAGLSALMMMSSTTSVFAAESGDKSTTLNYQVSSSYDWIIHSSIDFGADAGVGHTVERTGNQVKVLKNVIPEGKYLNISVKGSGANDAFTVDNGGSEVLNYDVSDDNGAVGVNGNVLSVPAGTNTATQNMNFKLNTTKKSAEVAGQYNGRVIYNASVGDKNGGTTSGGSTSGGTGGSESSGGAVTTPDGIEAGKRIRIDEKVYYIVKQTGNNKFLIVHDAGEAKYTDCLSYNAQKKDLDDYNIYENSNVDNYLENTWYQSLSEQLRNAIELTEIKQVSYKAEGDAPDNLKVMSPDDSNLDLKYDTNFKGQKYNTLKRHVYLPSVEDMASIGKNIKGMYATRDSVHAYPSLYWVSGLNSYDAFIPDNDSNSPFSTPNHVKFMIHPSFIVDLSKVDYELVK